MNLQEKKQNSKTVYNGKIVSLEIDEIELPDGKTSFRECVRHSGGAAVLLVKDDKILLVNQFRYLYGKPIYEILDRVRVEVCQPDRAQGELDVLPDPQFIGLDGTGL